MLFDQPRRPRRPRRVLMQLQDAGIDNYGRWKCPKCGLDCTAFYENNSRGTDDQWWGWPKRWSEPCPRCNTPEEGEERIRGLLPRSPLKEWGTSVEVSPRVTERT